MALNELVTRKSELLLQLQHTKAAAPRGLRAIHDLASKAARLESEIATLLIAGGRTEDGVVNLISAASCLIDAGRRLEADRIYNRAQLLTGSARTRDFIESERARLAPSSRAASTVFQAVDTHIDGNTSLRRPQREAYREVRTHFAATREHALVQLPVGCGKTGTMAIIPFGTAQGRVLVVTPNVEIGGNVHKKLDYTNTSSFLRAQGVLSNGRFPTCSYLNTKANVADCDASDIVVSNIQQLAASGFEKWIAKFPNDYFDMILVDEGHHGAAASWQRVFEAFPDARVTSFTATPLRADGKPVEGKRVYFFPIAAAIREGFVKDLACWKLELSEIDFVRKGERKRLSPDEVMKLREESWFRRGIALSPECNEHIVDASIQAVNRLRESGSVRHQIIGAACTIDHAKDVASRYRARGLEAEVIHSNLKREEQNKVRDDLDRGRLDAIVQVGMLGEGADYPKLGVAAIFRPFSHVVPYIQFVGRIMRVNVQNQVGHPDNRGFVVSHPGLHVDRWWQELKLLDAEDQQFLEELGAGAREFQPQGGAGASQRSYRPPMTVLNEVIEHFVEERFLSEEDALRLDDLIDAIQLRGFSLDELGLTKDAIAERMAERVAEARARRGKLTAQPVQPQRLREEARRRLNERIQSAAAELLNRLDLRVGGFELKAIGGGRSNLPAAIMLLNRKVNEKLGSSSGERDLPQQEQMQEIHDTIDDVVDEVVAEVQPRLARGSR